jgi:hypothetical protein
MLKKFLEITVSITPVKGDTATNKDVLAPLHKMNLPSAWMRDTPEVMYGNHCRA